MVHHKSNPTSQPQPKPPSRTTTGYYTIHLLALRLSFLLLTTTLLTLLLAILTSGNKPNAPARVVIDPTFASRSLIATVVGGLAGCVVFMGIDAVGVYFAWVGNSARARGCGGEDGKGAIVGVDGVGKGKGERERDGGDGWSGGKGVDVEKGAVELMDGGEWFGG